MAGPVLVVNAGSSSLKLRVVAEDGAVLASADLPPVEQALAAPGFREFLSRHPVGVAGHRVVHGGSEFQRAVLVTPEVRAALEAASDLAPLHNPPALRALDAAREVLPDVPHVVCFDTAFHSSISPAAATYAVPREWTERWGIRRFGFHGFSHANAARRAAELLAGRAPAPLRAVTCHLGAGASLAAVVDGRSVDTTMGFTPLDGLVMATRPGALDPGILTWVLRQGGLTTDELDEALSHRSGLLALSGHADMREVLRGAEAGDERCTLALGVYTRSLCAGVAAMAAAMGGLDALVFTGGVGEHAPEVRARAARALRFLGVAVDEARNQDVGEDDADVTAAGARVRVLVVHAREELEIAREVRDAVAASPGRGSA